MRRDNCMLTRNHRPDASLSIQPSPANINIDAMEPTTHPDQAISLKTAFWYWLKLGFISFGGPAGQIAMMHAELVDQRRWISERRFLHALNYCMLLPGPEATQLAVYIGWLMHRTIGGLMAGILFILPSLFILIGLSWAYMVFGKHHIVSGVLYGIKPAIVAIVLAAAWRIGSRSLRTHFLKGIAACAFIAITVLKLPFPAIVLFAACAGALFRQHCQLPTAHPDADSGQRTHPRALIDDDTPTPAHARFSLRHLILVTLAGLLLCAGAWSLIAYATGWHNPLTEMAWLFTKTALLSFGGAYAVLPYVFQSAVDHFQWLSAAQMMDGLALGETTPGPLIMVVAFVGFVSGWNQIPLGAESQLLAGLLGACIAFFFTFLPSFIFILAGGPLVESTRNQLRFTAPLTAISAAVVGVIVSLAVFFASHVFYTAQQQWDVPAIALTLLACILVFRFKPGTITLLAIFGVLGLLCQKLI